MKKTVIVLIDILLAVYLVFSVTTFNRPDELSNVCTEVKVDITDDVVTGFLNPDVVKSHDFDVLIVLGAGDLDNQVPELTRLLQEK